MAPSLSFSNPFAKWFRAERLADLDLFSPWMMKSLLLVVLPCAMHRVSPLTLGHVTSVTCNIQGFLASNREDHHAEHVFVLTETKTDGVPAQRRGNAQIPPDLVVSLS